MRIFPPGLRARTISAITWCGWGIRCRSGQIDYRVESGIRVRQVMGVSSYESYGQVRAFTGGLPQHGFGQAKPIARPSGTSRANRRVYRPGPHATSKTLPPLAGSTARSAASVCCFVRLLPTLNILVKEGRHNPS
jgi:hypothetical protein